MRVAAVRGAGFRCYERVSVDLPGGLVGVIGPNGAGKTALIEMIHFGCLGYSPRTSSEAQVVRFGGDVARVETDVELRTGAVSVSIGYHPGEPKRVTVDGVAERSIERLLGRFPVLVFTPDRLRVIQGAPALRRSYLDRALARLWPALAAASAEYARCLAQRNHLLRRIRAGAAQAGALDPWDALLGEAGDALTAARDRCCSRLAGPFAERLAALGGDPGERPLRYQPNAEPGRPLAQLLAERRGRDTERAATGAGPHLDDVGVYEHDRDLRLYGSQGEQRRALLALILAEADLLAQERDEPPLLLLDDVTGELDADRRRLLLDAVASLRSDDRDQHRRGRPGRAAGNHVADRGGAGDGMSELRPIGDDVRRLGRVPAVDPMVAAARRVWRDAVGPQVAANSLPVRRSGQSLVVHCASAAWSSELTLLERHVLRQLSGVLDPPPASLRFEVGDVQAPDLEQRAPAREPSPAPGPRELAQARELAQGDCRPGIAGGRRACHRRRPGARFVTLLVTGSGEGSGGPLW